MSSFKRKDYKESKANSMKAEPVPQGLWSKKIETSKSAATIDFLSGTKGSVIAPDMIHRVVTKMTFGSTEELNDYIQALPGNNEQQKIISYIDEQLDPQQISDPKVDVMLSNGYTTLNKSRVEFYQEHYRLPQGGDIPWETHIKPGRETYYSTFVKSTHSNRQLLEMMTDFWHNHFNVYMEADGVPAMFGHYDRDIIRPQALGNFRVMLEEVTTSTCMMDYLGNGSNHKDAPNENFARELLELHTIGAKYYLGHMPASDVPVDGEGRKVGYVEDDVIEMARVLTGWSYSGADWFDYQNGNIATGAFLYRDDWHDKNPKTIMGNDYLYDSGNTQKDVRDVLDMLAEHPATAEFLATKLCRRFISDDPPQDIIDQVKQTLHDNWQSPDQIKLGMETLLKSSDFLNTWGEKIKRPFERTISAMRQAGYTFDFSPNDPNASNHFWQFRNSGQSPFFWTSPNGYPDTKKDWLGSSSIMATWRFIQLICRWRDNSDVTYASILEQTMVALGSEQRTANNIVNYWFERACGITAPIETQDRLANFMSFDDTSNPQGTDRDVVIDLNTNEWPSYNQERLFAVVSTIFLTTEFNYR